MKTCDFQANIPGGFHGSTMVKRNNAAWHQAVPKKKKKKWGGEETEEPLSKLTAIKKKGLLFPWASLTFFPQFIHTFLDSRAQHCGRRLEMEMGSSPFLFLKGTVHVVSLESV